MFQKAAIAFVLFLGLQQANAQVWEDASNSGTKAPSESGIRSFRESDFQAYPWLNEFTNVIVINKANEGSDRQTLRLYVKGQLQYVTKTSTGRETYEKGCAPGQDPKKDHCSVRAYWSTTPVGYFDVDKLDEKYFSNLWKTWMPYSVFFESGIASHQAPAGTENKLGSRASGGCVRLHPDSAPVIFKVVQDAGKGLIPQISRNGQVKVTSSGDVVRAIGYKTLYIVINEIVQ